MEVTLTVGTSVDKESVKEKIERIEREKDKGEDKVDNKSKEVKADRLNDKEQVNGNNNERDKERANTDKDRKNDEDGKRDEKNGEKKNDKVSLSIFKEDKEPKKDKEEKKKEDKENKSRKGKDKEEKEVYVIKVSDRIRRPPRSIKVCEMKEDEEGSRFPQYRGYALALAGENYTIVACGIGEKEGEALPPRDITYKINDTTLMASHGFHNDVIHFNRDMQAKIDQCVETLGKPMSLLGMAGIIKALLFNRKLNTFFKCNILTGLDQHGGGCIYVFDQMGGFKRQAYAAGGSHSTNMYNLLTRTIALSDSRSVQVPVDENEAVAILTDVFRSAAKQKIFNGFAVAIHRITASGVVEEFRSVAS